MNKKIYAGLSILVVLVLLSAACRSTAPSGPPSNAQVIQVIASTNLQSWLDQSAQEFNQQEIESPSGKPYYVVTSYADAGRVVADGVQSQRLPALWVPDSYAWAQMMAERGNAAYQDDCQSIVQSPLVIAMWQPLAEALGWPGRDLGWLDIGSLAADPSAWLYYSGGQFGPALRVGHAHPGLSGAGASTLLAVVHAAESSAESLDAAQISQPIVQASVGAFEGSVSTFSPNTADLWASMRERGSSYLGAAVVYENQIFEAKDQQPAIVPIYPFEGTFVADFPACVANSAGDDERAGAVQFRQYLLSAPAQEQAQALGLRPVGSGVAATAFDGTIFSLEKPSATFAEPSVDVIYAIQDLWQAARKAVNLVMVIDTSGSMEGSKIESVRQAAAEFIQTMGDNDYLSILTYPGGSEVERLVYATQVGPARQQIIQAVQNLKARQATPLYDSIGEAAQVIAETTSSRTSNAIVILSDGRDTFSTRYTFDNNLISLTVANSTTVYTIAYGGDADVEILQSLAARANGNFYLGDQASIASIYQEMSVIFGGSAGIGR